MPFFPSPDPQPVHDLLLPAAIFIVALLYACVGHAGASGYIAVLALAGFLPEEIKPAALVLNILVAALGAFQFWRAGHFLWRLFWPFALTAIPLAFLGGRIALPPSLFKPIVGVVLLCSALRLLWRGGDPQQTAPPRLPVALGAGAGLGLLAGLTGTGGGIFLSPLMLHLKWAPMRQVAATSVFFILVNSLAGLGGILSSGQPVPNFVWGLCLAAVAGGALGAHLGSRRLPARAIGWALAGVLAMAGVKFLMAK